MRKHILILIVILLIKVQIYSKTNDEFLTESISKTKIKIGENIILKIKASNLENVKVLWEDMSCTENNAYISSKKHYYKGSNLNFEIIFTFFEPGNHNDFSFTIPVSTSNGEILYLNSKRYNIKVENPLTREEIENIKKIKDPAAIELKKEKAQANIPFFFSFYLKILLAVLIFIILALISYYFFYKFIMKKGSNEIKNMPPYQKFLIQLERVRFNKDDIRKETEKKLSEITKALKELIYDYFSFNAPSETTKELILMMRKTNFDNEIIKEINDLFNEIDMIKFAKAPVVFESLKKYLNDIKLLGNKIHHYKLSLTPDEDENENLQTE